MTIEDIATRTKIKATFLQAIERGEFEQLPGEFFARAFVRTYAREVQLSPDEIVAAYDARYRPADHERPAAREAQHPVETTAFPWERIFAFASARSVWPTVALAGAVLLVLSLMDRPSPESSSELRPVGTAGAAEPTPEAQAQPARKAPEKLNVEIQPSRTLWVAGMADGKRVIYRLVERGERVRIDAQDDLWFRVGDAGAFVYSVNGSPARPLGRPGEVREFTITRENYAALTR